MKLDDESARLLGRSRIGMLGLVAGTTPLVNPAAFYFGGDAVWMTTSRHAAKVALARKRPAGTFLVDGGESAVVLEGELEVFDPRSLPNFARAALEGPGFALNLAGYAVKNAPFIGGYLRDISKVPAEWWPHNRALLRLAATRAYKLPSVPPVPAAGAALPGLPQPVRRAIGREAVAYLCTLVDGVPLMAPAVWAVSEAGIQVVTTVAGFLDLEKGRPGGLAVEYHHQYRATRMVGAYYRGGFQVREDAREAIAERYRTDASPKGMALAFSPARVTWWQGFDIESKPIREEAAGTAPRGRRAASG